MDIVHYIESKGFKVRGKRIYKQNGKPIGQVNENNFYIFASNNIYPFQSGINYVENKTLTNGKRLRGEDTACGSSFHSDPTPNKELSDEFIKVKRNESRKIAKKVKKTPTKDNPEIINKFPVYKQDYTDATSLNSVFNTYLDDLTNTHLGTDAKNYFNLRGVKEGYLKGAVVFPIYKPDGEFYTGHIIKYANNGKRVKKGASINWFHTYKDIVKNLINCQADTDIYKYSLPQKHFFGGQQIHQNENPIAIVEAPKTASIMKEFYPDINWIASIGIGGLKSKNLEILRGRDVMIFPDAKSNDWDAIASVYRWSKFDVLDVYDAEEGSDIVDYFFDTEFKGYNSIRKVLDEVSDGYYDFDAVIDDSICFELLDDIYQRDDYFTILSTTKNLIFARDNSSAHNVVFNGLDFNIYEDSYQSYNAQIDWHGKTITNERYPTYFDEDEFVYNLKKCYVLLKQFNPEGKYKKAYRKGLKRLNKLSNFRFNVSHVMNTMVRVWDNEDINVRDYVKLRDWKYKGGEQLTKFEFVRKLNDDRFKYKLQLRLSGFLDATKEKRFIDYETDLGLSKDASVRGYGSIIKLVRQWNEEVIGAKTYKTWLIKNDFESKLYEHFISGTKNSPLHIDNIYIGAKKVYQDYNYKQISEITGITNKATIKKFKLFKANADTRTLIIGAIKLILDNIKHTVLERKVNSKNGKIRISSFEPVKPASKSMTKYNTSPVDAFGLPADEDGNIAKLNASDLMHYSIEQHRAPTDKMTKNQTKLDCFNRIVKGKGFLYYELERLEKLRDSNNLYCTTKQKHVIYELFENDFKYVTSNN